VCALRDEWQEVTGNVPSSRGDPVVIAMNATREWATWQAMIKFVAGDDLAPQEPPG